MKKCTFILVMAGILSACTTSPKSKVVTEESADRPSWVNGTKVTWHDGDKILYRQHYSVKGDERLNGCYQLAKLEAKESVVREIAEELRGQIDNAQMSLSESAELVLSQVRSSEYNGKITGMRFTEQYHERILTNDVERLDCFVLAEINKTEFDLIKRQMLTKVAQADAEVKKAIQQRSVKFFTGQPTEPKTVVVQGQNEE